MFDSIVAEFIMMKTPFSTIVRRLEIVSRLENEESGDLSDMFTDGLGLRYGSPEAAAMRREPHPCAAAQLSFLKSLPTEALRALVVLMYTGRDREGDPLDNLNVVTERGRMIDAIDEKSPRMQYINRGIELLNGMSLDMYYAEVVRRTRPVTA
jgi:hypothetical protein